MAYAVAAAHRLAAIAEEFELTQPRLRGGIFVSQRPLPRTYFCLIFWLNSFSVDKMATTDAESVRRWRDELEQDLFARTLPFWMSFSVDDKHGGFFNCLDHDGAVFDSHKHIWLQGRECWMLAKIANAYSDAELAALTAKWPAAISFARSPKTLVPGVKHHDLTRAELIKVAEAGVRFLLAKAVQADGTVLFCLTEAGEPALVQRKIFSATFLIIALNEVAAATGDVSLRTEAFKLLDSVLGWIKNPTALGRPVLTGATPYVPLNISMILLNVIGELKAESSHADTVKWCVAEIRKHYVTLPGKGPDGTDLKVVLENVLSDGSADLSCPDGRLVNPGHAIEAGWFLLDYAQRAGDEELKATALEIIEGSFLYGWDSAEHGGGILYFKDVLGFTPTQLEWDMKLWWPHCEALVAFSMAYAATKDAKYLRHFEAVAEWAYSHLVDKTEGEWWGYANRAGTVTHQFKGGPYKGCFHVPRALWMTVVQLDKAMK